MAAVVTSQLPVKTLRIILKILSLMFVKETTKTFCPENSFPRNHKLKHVEFSGTRRKLKCRVRTRNLIFPRLRIVWKSGVSMAERKFWIILPTRENVEDGFPCTDVKTRIKSFHKHRRCKRLNNSRKTQTWRRL